MEWELLASPICRLNGLASTRCSAFLRSKRRIRTISALGGLRFRETGFCGQRQTAEIVTQPQVSRLWRSRKARAPRQSGPIAKSPGNLQWAASAWWGRYYIALILIRSSPPVGRRWHRWRACCADTQIEVDLPPNGASMEMGSLRGPGYATLRGALGRVLKEIVLEHARLQPFVWRPRIGRNLSVTPSRDRIERFVTNRCALDQGSVHHRPEPPKR